MQEVTPKISAEPKKEVEPELPYKFLREMNDDYPEIVKILQERLPQWQQSLDEMAEIPGFADTVLRHVEYVSQEQEEKAFQAIAREVAAKLQAEPNKTHIRVGLYNNSSRSVNYMWDHILPHIDPELQKKLINPPNLLRYDDYIMGEEPLVLYFIDDSANSGQQLQMTIQHSLGDIARGDRQTGIEFHSYLFGMTEETKALLIPFLKRNLHASQENTPNPEQWYWHSDEHADTVVQVDAPKTPTMDDVLDELEAAGKITHEQRGKLPIMAHHGRNSGTLLLFYHRLLQDNVPAFFTEGALTAAFSQVGVEPLFAGLKTTNQYPSQPEVSATPAASAPSTPAI